MPLSKIFIDLSFFLAMRESSILETNNGLYKRAGLFAAVRTAIYTN